MRICLTANTDSLESKLEPRFGRCSFFAIADLETSEIEFINNDAITFGGGAGVSSGQLMIDKGVKAIITGNVGPNAMNVLKTAGITVYRGINSTIEKNIKMFEDDELEQIHDITPSHFGMRNNRNR